jgi:site-specific recombinase XerD
MPTRGKAGQRPRRQAEVRQQQQRTPEAAVAWFLTWVAREKSEKTLVNYTATISTFLTAFPDLGASGSEVEDWLFRTRMNGKQGSINTRRAEAICLKSFFSFCVRVGVIEADENPMASVKMPVEPKRVAAKGVPRSTINGIVKECTEPWKLLVLILLADAGLRANEVCTVPPEALKTAGTSHYLQLVGKGSKERIVPVSKRLVALWKAQAGQVGAETPICRSATGHVLSNTRIWQVAVDSGLAAGFADMHPHRWRHSWACWLYFEKSIPLVKVSRLLGHSSIMTTMTYLGVHDHELIDLGSVFDDQA